MDDDLDLILFLPEEAVESMDPLEALLGGGVCACDSMTGGGRIPPSEVRSLGFRRIPDGEGGGAREGPLTDLSRTGLRRST